MVLMKGRMSKGGWRRGYVVATQVGIELVND